MANTSPQFCWKVKFSPKRTKFTMTIWRDQVTQHLLLSWPENYPTHWTACKSLQVGQWEPEAQISRYSRGQTAPWCGHWGQKLWTHGFEDTTWQCVIFYFSSTEAMGTLTLQHSPTFLSPIKSQIKDLAVVIYPIPLCNAIRCLETPWVLNSNYCVFLFFFCLTDQKSFLHIFCYVTWSTDLRHLPLLIKYPESHR